VLLSGRGEPEAEEAEKALRATSVDWTIIRASWFLQNLSGSFFLDALLAGRFVVPEGLAPEPFVDAEDVADIAAAALTGPGHGRTLYEVTGPRAMTFAEAVSGIARASGRTIEVQTVPLDAFRKALEDAHLPPDVAGLVVHLFATVLDGRNTPTADGVRRARPPAGELPRLRGEDRRDGPLGAER
jgi:uncharacterized protein YbjT (DUF2867 family)